MSSMHPDQATAARLAGLAPDSPYVHGQIGDGTLTTDPTIERPFDVLVPSTYDPDTPIPLVVLLHGYSGTSDVVGDYFKLDSLAESRRFLLVSPDGTVDGQGFQYWNAMEACCSFGSDTPDDAAYLKAVIDQVSQDYNVDDRRIYLTGHSNGGFMSYRMACDFAETVAAVGSVAGATRGNDALCTPSEPVSVLQVHGTEDFVISYDGDDLEGAFVPSAPETVARWAVHNGCDSTPVPADNLDLDGFLPGSETEVETFENCARGSAVELWSIIGASHSPALTEDFANGLIDFFFDHPKP